MSAPKKSRVAVIGSGFGLYGILPAFQQIPECEVVGICGKSSERLVNYCRQTAIPVFSDWRVMLDQARPDAIAVAVIPRHQQEIIAFALERGIAVFAEKPLAMDLAQAAALLKEARAKKVAHMVDFLFPEIPEWRRAKELLEQGAIGPVRQFDLHWLFLSHDIKNKIEGWKTRPEEGGGALSFYFSHAFHNLEFFLGKIQTVRCVLTRAPDAPGPGETGIRLWLKFENGCAGNVIFDCASPKDDIHSWNFLGDTGTLSLHKAPGSFTRGNHLLLQSNNGALEEISVPPLPFDPSLDERVPLVKSLAERFIHWQRSSIPAQPDFAAGLRVQELIELARQFSPPKKTGTN